MDAVPVPELSQWFSADEGEAPDAAPKWIVRGLGGDEYARAQDVQNKAERALQLAQGFAAGHGKDIQEGLASMLGYGAEAHPEFGKRVELLKMGSVAPKIEHGDAVKLGKHFPLVLWRLTNRVLELSGQGSTAAVKPPPSGDVET
jgi:hypothetical protein